jgi:bifunctional non-homologous end joining protein LigD
MRELAEKFDSIIRPAPPFRTAPKPKSNERFTWLDPVLVAEIKFAEWTADGQLRQASFKGLRADKDPRSIRQEEPDGDTTSVDIREPSPEDTKEARKSVNVKEDNLTIGGVSISNPGKVIFEDPIVTKADVVRYYDAISARMLPYVRGRILSIVRCPRGIAQACFYKKHPGPDNKGIVTIPITNSDGQTEDYFYIEDAVGLIREAQMGTLEFHTWGSRAEALETPDVMVFDLDPDEGMAPDQIRRGVRDLQSILGQLSLLSFLKTSGGKGYHVVVPFTPSAAWDAFHDFARRIAEVMAQQWPDRYTSNVRKNKRGNKIFIDWMRNGRGATSIAPYSLRARKGARVSMPIPWDALDTVAPDSITMEDALGRIGGPDPWQGFFATEQRLKL